MADWRLSAQEKADYDKDGYLLRTGVFDRDEIGAITDLCENLLSGLVAASKGHRMPLGSYVFEADMANDTILKWEGDTDAVHGIEPFAHLSPELQDWAYDPRFIDPMRDVIGDDDPTLFTEKLNLKRSQVGGPNPTHQDFPYWENEAKDAERLATATLYLDDTTVENGCLEVLPGSHRQGVWKTRSDADVFGNNEMAPISEELTRLEVEAGSVVIFGPYLVHATAPNRTDRDRRALLYTYQPAGYPHMIENLRRLTRSRG